MASDRRGHQADSFSNFRAYPRANAHGVGGKRNENDAEEIRPGQHESFVALKSADAAGDAASRVEE